MATTRTTIDDISALGPELNEGQLLMVTGGQSKDGGTDTNPQGCSGGCHGFAGSSRDNNALIPRQYRVRGKQ